MEEAGGNKRARELPEVELREAKRLREAEADLIFDILADEDDVEPDAGLSDVIKSLEDEITADAPASAEEVKGSPELDLGYLLEASDDELGIPPAAEVEISASPTSSASADGGEVVQFPFQEPQVADFDPIWGAEDGCFDFGLPAEFDDGVNFDGGLFDFSDVAGGPGDDEDFPWPTESVTVV